MKITLSSFLILLSIYGPAQMITGVWKGKINRQKCELKIIQSGDSLKGTSYYYESANSFRRYSIRGFFDPATNEAVWWDDQLIEERPARTSGKAALLARADFNCPGGGKMMLDGKSVKKADRSGESNLHFDKVQDPDFEDEWDFVIDNYLVGANDPYIIDSIDAISFKPVDVVNSEPVTFNEKPVTSEVIQKPPVVVEPITQEPARPVVVAAPARPQSIEEKFVARKKVLVKEIPVTGDSIELRFYDNAEIDGDSISLFLNERLIFSHIRLTGNAYSIKLPVAELNGSNELIMVAENLGSIPPNTSYMVAIVGENRYEARLESTEGSSAMIRFVRR